MIVVIFLCTREPREPRELVWLGMALFADGIMNRGFLLFHNGTKETRTQRFGFVRAQSSFKHVKSNLKVK